MVSTNTDLSKEHFLRVSYGDNALEGEEVIRFSHTSALCGDIISIGTVCPASIRFETARRVNLLDADLSVSAVFPDGTEPLGAFRVTACRRTDYSAEVEAYDALYWATGRTYTPNVDESPTIREIVEDLAAQIGVEVEVDTIPQDAASAIVSGSLEGFTIREMLGYMAGLCGRNAVLSRENRLRFVWFRQTQEEEPTACTGVLGRDRLGKFILGRSPMMRRSVEVSAPNDYYLGGLDISGRYLLAGVTCRVQDGNTENELNAGSGSGYLCSLANPFMTQERLDAIWNDIGGLSGHMGTAEMPYGFGVEPGDILPFDGVEGRADLLTTSVTLSLDGGCKCAVTAAGNSDTEQNAAFEGTLTQAVRRLELDLLEVRRLVAQEAEIFNARITNLSVEDIKAGIIHSPDYKTAEIPLVYPGGDVFPSEDLYPSNGEEVTQGFAIDFGLGVMYGAFFNANLEKRIAELEERMRKAGL